jgi:hypothetical protein
MASLGYEPTSLNRTGETTDWSAVQAGGLLFGTVMAPGC